MSSGVRVLDVLRRQVRQSTAYELGNTVRLQLRLLSEPRRALPDFLVIGVHKGGTTSFYRNLCRHPQIRPALDKEIHYFDRRPVPSQDWYRAHFPPVDQLEREGAITGEASPSYILMPHAPEAVRRLVPDCKLILLLRDPVARAYSAYQFNTRRKASGRSFEEWIERDFRLLGDRPVTRQIFLDHLGDRARTERAPTGLLRGVYVEQIRNWHRVFPPDRLLILDSTEYFRRPVEVLGSVATGTLGLGEHPFVYEDTRNDKRTYPRMAEETERRLRAFFRPYNEALYEYLGRDFGW